MIELELIKRRLEREKKARQQAESILEQKSMELYLANQELKLLNQNLELIVKERTNELQAKDKVYRSIVESASDIIYRTNPYGKITFANPAAIKLIGYSEKELTRGSYIDFVKPEYRDILLNFYKKQEEELKPNTYLEFPIVSKDGKTIWLGQSLQMFFRMGKMTEAIAVARDITERREAEQALISATSRLSALIENLQSGVLVEDENRGIVLINQHFCDLFSIPAPPPAMIGMDCSDSAEQSKAMFQNPEEFVSRIIQILNKQEIVVEEELLLVDGRTFKRDYIPIFSEGKYLGHLWQYKDVTKAKNDEQELIKAKHDAEKAQQAEKQFLAHISHEIRTPLNAVIGMNYLMMDTNLSDEQLEYLMTIKHSSDLLLNLVNDVLDFSKIEAGEIIFEENEFDVEELIHAAQKSLETQLAQKPVQISHLVTNKTNRKIISDRTSLNQILFNLIGNATKFTNKGEIRIHCLIESKNDKSWMKLSISDTGIGISKKKLEHIFGEFKQAKSTIEASGTGLGLPITKKLVELQGGNIEVESTEKKGSTFTVNLPVKLGAAITGHPDENIDLDYLEYVVDTNARILVVEDNVVNQRYVAKLMKKWGFETDLASDGNLAIDFAEQQVYNLVFMDIQMPVMNGYETAKLIRSLKENPNSHIPIVALTAAALTSEKDKAFRTGMNDYLSKPFSPNQLLSLLMKFFPFKTRSQVLQKQEIPFSNHSKIIDYQSLQKLYQGDMEHLIEMFSIFLKNTPEALNKLQLLKKEMDLTELKKVLHKIKPTFQMVGLEFVGDKVELVEHQAERGNLLSPVLDDIIEEIPGYLMEIQQELKHLKQEL